MVAEFRGFIINSGLRDTVYARFIKAFFAVIVKNSAGIRRIGEYFLSVSYGEAELTQD